MNQLNRAILDYLDRHRNGVAVSEFEEQLEIPRRTIQRRLAKLVKNEQVKAEGLARGRKYFPIQQDHLVREGWQSYDQSNRSIQEYLALPLSERKPVSYKKAFMESYRPGKDFYFSDAERQSLLQWGTIANDDLPAGTYLRQILDRLLIDLSWNSSRLEGNTYSLLDTERLINQGEHASEKESEETQMILNHKAAIELLADQADEIDFNYYTICNIHSLLADNLLPDSSAAGRTRIRGVGVSGSTYLPMQIPQIIEEEFSFFLNKAQQITNAFEQSLFAMIFLPYMQAFEDVNKRVSRLAANIPLVKKNLCPLSFSDVGREEYIAALLAIYELNEIGPMKDLYLRAYQRSCEKYKVVKESLGEPDLFNLKYRRELKKLVRELVLRFDETEFILKNLSDLEIEIPEEDQSLFMARVRDELENLHMGNIARYKLRPREFEKWSEG